MTKPNFNYISPSVQQRASLRKALDQLEHLGHICDPFDEFQVFTVGTLSFILEALIPDLARGES